MNKKNISLILIGILLLVLQFYVRVGNATIDVFSDVIGFILIVIGILPLAPRNVLFKKARLAAILGTAAAVIGQCPLPSIVQAPLFSQEKLPSQALKDTAVPDQSAICSPA